MQNSEICTSNYLVMVSKLVFFNQFLFTFEQNHIMSRNNLIVVVRDKREKKFKFHIFANICADTDWNSESLKIMIDATNTKWTYSRGKALCMAHNIQKKIETEYGVWEIDVK